jgi:hypothetical protein
MSGWEEEYLERHAADPNTARLCNDVLAFCLVPPGQDPGDARRTVESLLVADRDRELVALRRLSLGPEVSAQVVCPSCGASSEAEFSLDALDLDLPGADGPVSVDLEGLGEVTLRLPTARDQEDLVDADLSTEAERLSWLLARCLLRVGPRTDGFDMDVARGLPARARRAIEAALEAVLPVLDLEMAVECAQCGAGFSAPFDVSSFFFRDDRPCPGSPARRARPRARVSLERAGHPRTDHRATARLPHAAGGGRRRRAPGRSPRRARLSAAAWPR